MNVAHYSLISGQKQVTRILTLNSAGRCVLCLRAQQIPLSKRERACCPKRLWTNAQKVINFRDWDSPAASLNRTKPRNLSTNKMIKNLRKCKSTFYLLLLRFYVNVYSIYYYYETNNMNFFNYNQTVDFIKNPYF